MRRLLLLLLAAAAALAAPPPASPSDAAAMLALAASISGANSIGWNSSADPCTWPHVGCSPTGRVTAIQIGSQKLSGTLSASISKLDQLQILEVMSNSLSGPVPAMPAALQRLLLHDNAFTSLPPNFFAPLTSIQDVALDRNPFSSWSVTPNDLNSASLATFTAARTNFTGEVPEFFATAFPGLHVLSLAQNPITGSIPPAFSKSTIQKLYLNGVRKGGGLSGGIEAIAGMSALTDISLQANSFTGPIPDLSALTELQNLNLRDNFLTGPVPGTLTGMKSLGTVNLTNNYLQGPVPVFRGSVNVDLDPATESFCGVECDPRVNVLLSIVSSFGYPLKLAQNWKGNDTCNQWLGIVCNAGGNVTVVNFASMGLSGTISPDFASLPALVRIVLSGNNITGTIPSSLAGLKFLKDLDVSNNDLWGAVPSFGDGVTVNTSGNPNIGKDGPPSSTSGGKKSSNSIVVFGIVIVVILALLVVASLCFCYRKRIQKYFGRKKNVNVKHTLLQPQHSGTDLEMMKMTSFTSSNTTDHNLVIPIQVLRDATDDFSKENILGRGGFGTVYRGKIDGYFVAVKRMIPGAVGSEGLGEFKSEITVLTKVRHRHLVSLLGYCLDGNEKILVYEYMPQGTLSDHLFNWMEAGLKPLDWKSRLSIALDVARGVEYLHRMAHQSFIHRDLKPSNILLGDDMKAKVADFGLVRLAPEGQNCSIQTRVAGTFGYLAPEYAITGRVTTKADVYSFGVILMELITGRKALNQCEGEDDIHLVTWFRRMLLNNDTFQKAIDPLIELGNDEGTLESIHTIAELAGHCCAREPHQRPDMGHAVNVLSSLAEMWKPADDMEASFRNLPNMSLLQSVQMWQATGDSQSDDSTQSFLQSRETTQGSIPTGPGAFSSFTSLDGR